MVLRAFGPPPTPPLRVTRRILFLDFFRLSGIGAFWRPSAFRGTSQLLLALLEERLMLDPSRFLRFRGMSQLLLALLEVRSLSFLDFSWDVQATFGTFGS